MQRIKAHLHDTTKAVYMEIINNTRGGIEGNATIPVHRPFMVKFDIRLYTHLFENVCQDKNLIRLVVS
jgi:hypothetical protein